MLWENNATLGAFDKDCSNSLLIINLVSETLLYYGTEGVFYYLGHTPLLMVSLAVCQDLQAHIQHDLHES